MRTVKNIPNQNYFRFALAAVLLGAAFTVAPSTVFAQFVGAIRYTIAGNEIISETGVLRANSLDVWFKFALPLNAFPADQIKAISGKILVDEITFERSKGDSIFQNWVRVPGTLRVGGLFYVALCLAKDCPELLPNLHFVFGDPRWPDGIEVRHDDSFELPETELFDSPIIWIGVTITNSSSTAAITDPFFVTFSVNDQVVREVKITGRVGAGDLYMPRIEIQLFAREYTIRAEVDSKKQITESREDDNIVTRKIIVNRRPLHLVKRPQILSSSVRDGLFGTIFSMSFSAEKGYLYSMEYKNSLADGLWKRSWVVRPQNNEVITFTDRAFEGGEPMPTQRFYRVRVE